MTLLPCPFCGGGAEIDTNQGFCAFPSGRMETAISVYCRECTAAVTVCKSDVPGLWAEEVEEMWNRRIATPDDHELLAIWMIENSYATGHGDTFADLLAELTWQHAERAAIREQDETA